MKSYVPPYKYELDVITPAINRNLYKEPIIVDGATYIECVTSRKYENPEYGDAFLGGEFPGGTTTVEGVPTAASIKVFYRAPGMHFDGLQAAETHSGDDGTWFVGGLYSHLRYDVVARLEGRNDVIVSNVQAARIDVITLEGEFASNEDFNGIDGEILITSGLPPFTATVIQPLPYGLNPVVDGRKLVIDGTSEDEGVWNSVVRVTASNGVWVDVPVQVQIQVLHLDPHWDKVVSLLHFDGDFVDQTGKVWEPTGVPSTTSVNPAFGSGSVEKRGGTGYLVTGHSDDFIFPDDFTIEAWILTDAGAVHTMLTQYVNSGNELLPLYLDSASSGRVFWKSSNAITGLVLPVGEWFHYALTRESGVLRAFVNGVLKGSATRNGTVGVAGGVRLLGEQVGYSGWRGQLDEFRITKGVARYTANFDPPTEPFPSR